YLNDLRALFSDRYKKTGVITDLNKAIRLIRQVVNITLENNLLRGLYLIRQLYNLRNKLLAKYIKTGDTADLEESIRITRQVVNTTLEDYLN
ncbi:hypothetical protein DL95DRAFT_319810, partial [Leptodontidium sp. 2 PMI_412]